MSRHTVLRISFARASIFLTPLLVAALNQGQASGQDSHQVPQTVLVVPAGYRLVIDVKFESAQENVLAITKQSDRSLQRTYNSIFGERFPFEAPTGGGQWKSPVAQEKTVYFLTGQHKDTGREGGGGKPYKLSKYMVFDANEEEGIVGYDDSANDGDYNDVTVKYRIESAAK